jgi:hypothetical protein
MKFLVVNNNVLLQRVQLRSSSLCNKSCALLESNAPVGSSAKIIAGLWTDALVTHDPVAASYSNRVIMLKDGNIHSEVYQGEDTNIHVFIKIFKSMQ